MGDEVSTPQRENWREKIVTNMTQDAPKENNQFYSNRLPSHHTSDDFR